MQCFLIFLGKLLPTGLGMWLTAPGLGFWPEFLFLAGPLRGTLFTQLCWPSGPEVHSRNTVLNWRAVQLGCPWLIAQYWADCLETDCARPQVPIPRSTWAQALFPWRKPFLRNSLVSLTLDLASRPAVQWTLPHSCTFWTEPGTDSHSGVHWAPGLGLGLANCR